MPRVARIVLEGQPHHITQRGNNRQDVFFLDDDRLAYLELLRIHGERFGFRVLGYCLITNHVHLIGVPARQESLAKAVGRTNFRYTQYINQMHGRSGHRHTLVDRRRQGVHRRPAGWQPRGRMV